MSDTVWPVSDEELATVQTVLAKLEPGFLPLPIFLQTTRLTVTPVVEIVPLRQQGETIQVLLIERDGSNGSLWPPHTLHTPGTVIRATDQLADPYADAFRRILGGELQGAATAAPPQYVQTLFHHSGRGMELAQIFFVAITGDPATGSWHDADALPAATMRSQLDFIAAAVQRFRDQQAGAASLPAPVAHL